MVTDMGQYLLLRHLDDMCYGYAVATAYEGHNLRRHGIDKPIVYTGSMLMNVPVRYGDRTKKCYHLCLHIEMAKGYVTITQLSLNKAVKN